jgi:CRP/FNR family cyclic AMP-dependent transcriptional regulator
MSFGFSAWLLVNLHAIPGIEPFDPFPFNLLTTVVSLEAIFLTLFVFSARFAGKAMRVS